MVSSTRFRATRAAWKDQSDRSPERRFGSAVEFQIRDTQTLAPVDRLSGGGGGGTISLGVPIILEGARPTPMGLVAEECGDDKNPTPPARVWPDALAIAHCPPVLPLQSWPPFLT